MSDSSGFYISRWGLIISGIETNYIHIQCDTGGLVNPRSKLFNGVGRHTAKHCVFSAGHTGCR